MTPYYTHYTNWEDWKNGMYREINKQDEEMYVSLSSECLKNPENAMLKVVIEWEESTKENLSNKQQNRKSWLGQAACCIQHNSPEQCTRIAWNKLTKEERNNANEIAKNIIELWERYYSVNQS